MMLSKSIYSRIWALIAVIYLLSMDHSSRVEGLCNNGHHCNDGDVCLERGSGDWEGNVMVCSNGVWGAVCSDDWDMDDAKVTCRQLGYDTETVDYYRKSYFGYRQPETPTVLNGVQCVGNEDNLTECNAMEKIGTDVQYCDPGNMAGVFCGYGKACLNGEIRLTSSNCFPQSTPPIHCKTGRGAGRVEYCREGQWTYISNDKLYTWSVNEAEVACKQLGFISNKVDNVYIGGNGFLSRMNCSYMQCTGYENLLAECLKVSTECPGPYHSAGVTCYSYGGGNGCSQGDVRLYSAFNDTPANEGVLQICSEYNTWHSACYDSYLSSPYIAKAVCIQLGYRGALAVRYNGGFYYGYSEYSDRFSYSCNDASYTNLLQCKHTKYDKYPICGGNIYNTMGLVCYTAVNECTNGSVRLVSTDTGLSDIDKGRVEYCYDNMWSPVCNLTSITATLMCQKMGFEFAKYSVITDDDNKRSNKKSSFDYVQCDASATQLSDCNEYSKDTESSAWFVADTSCAQEYTLKCFSYEACKNDSKRIRLGKNSTEQTSEGILEVCYHDKWVMVSMEKDMWTEKLTEVACGNLGYSTGDHESIDVSDGEISLYISNISCNGNERNLTNCDVTLTTWSNYITSENFSAVRLHCYLRLEKYISLAASTIGIPVLIITTVIAVSVLILVVIIRYRARAARRNRLIMKDSNPDGVSIVSMFGDNDKQHLLQTENMW